MTLTLVGVSYNAAGQHCMIVLPTSDDTELDDLAFSSGSGCIQARLLKTDYDLLPPPVNVGGAMIFHDLNKALVAQVTGIDAGVGANLQTIIDATSLALGVSTVTTPLRVGNSIIVDGITYTCTSQAYDTVSDAAGVGQFGDWPGHPGAIKITGIGGGPLVTGGGGDHTLSMEFSATSVSAIQTGARITFSAAVDDTAVASVDASISDDIFTISEALHLLKSEDPGVHGADVLTDAVTFASPQTSMTAVLSGADVAADMGAINYITLGFII